MDRLAAQALYMKIVFGVLGLSTYVLVASVLSFRPATEPKNILTSMVRLPAALPAAIPLPVNLPMFSPVEKIQEPFKIDTLALSCWDSSQHQSQSTKARMVRLTGRTCTDGWQASSWKVSNISNGFSATVFETSPKQMTTDFVPLQAGKNEIQFVILAMDGSSHEVSMTIERF